VGQQSSHYRLITKKVVVLENLDIFVENSRTKTKKEAVISNKLYITKNT